MKTWKIITVTVIALVAAALLTASAFAYMGGRGFYSPDGTNTGTGSYGAYPGGMMGGRMGGMMGGGYAGNPQSGTTPPPTSSGQYRMGGCHGWNGYASPTTPTQGVAITLDKAVDIAKTYLASLNNPDLAIDEVDA